MAQIGGEAAAQRAKRSSGAGPDAGDGEDRLGALPDDVLVLILLRLDTPAAARTSVLARRWRRLWALLPELSFHVGPDGHRIRAALDGPGAGEAPALRRVSVTAEDAAPDALAAWLPAAERRLSGELVYQNTAPANREQDGGAVPLPCFRKATAIDLDLGFLGLALPSSRSFSRLTELCLSRVRFRGLGELGDAVSSPRCPNLRKLSIRRASGVEWSGVVGAAAAAAAAADVEAEALTSALRSAHLVTRPAATVLPLHRCAPPCAGRSVRRGRLSACAVPASAFEPPTAARPCSEPTTTVQLGGGGNTGEVAPLRDPCGATRSGGGDLRRQERGLRGRCRGGGRPQE